MADNIWTAAVEGIAARGRANNGAEGDYRDEEGFEHQGQALIKTTKPNTAVNLNSGAFAHFHDGSLVDRSDLVLIHQADLPSEMPDSLKGGRNNG